MSFFKDLLRARPQEVGELLRAKYASLRRLLAANNEVLELITELEEAVQAARLTRCKSECRNPRARTSPARRRVSPGRNARGCSDSAG